MKDITIAGNWKSNKTVGEAKTWFGDFSRMYEEKKLDLRGSTILIFVPYTHLYPLREQIESLHIPISLGAQSVSPYPDGAYTGQISARMIKEMADWVIIGHSERRKYFHETDEDLKRSVEKAKEEGLSVIYCVSDAHMPVPHTVDVVAYEPLWAIGTGKTDTPENADSVIAKIMQVSGIGKAIYGGSVTDANVASFVAQPSIDGVLPGGASLDASTFFSLIFNSITSSV